MKSKNEPSPSRQPAVRRKSPRPRPSAPAAADPPAPGGEATPKSPRRRSPRATPRRVTARVPQRKPLPAVPPILLEGDATPVPQPGGPGVRYALGPQPPTERFRRGTEKGELPVAYGTRRLLLAARDPHWVYAHWDLTDQQLREYNARSIDQHLVLRVYRDAVQGEPEAEVHVHPESRNWFVHVGIGGARYVAELGYFALRDRRWTHIATSGPTLTPPDSLSPDTTVQFATIPANVTFEALTSVIKAAVATHVPLAEAILQLKATGYRGLPEPEAFAQAPWTPEQEKALAQIVSMDSVRRVWVGSLEVTELVRRHLAGQISSAAAAQLAGLPPVVEALGSLASPYGGLERKKGFWFNINAELILYGATEPDARVTIGDRAIRLRPDGSFSYRFALPDGEYHLPAVAVAADGDDRRQADLRFARDTRYRGVVTAHPQDPQLKPPRPEHVG